MTHAVTVTLAALGVAGQVLAALLLLLAVAWVAGVRAPALLLRELVEGYELWLVFLVSAIATGGSLFFSEIAGFVPCELCWYQRICMYPLSITTLRMPFHVGRNTRCSRCPSSAQEFRSTTS